MLFASFVVYGAMYVAPGSPVGFLLRGTNATPQAVAAVKAEYHLNDPFLVAYWHWLTGLLQGHLGTSVITHESAWSLISPRLGTTVFLVTYASVLILVVGIGTGLVAALRPRFLGSSLIAAATVGMAIPPFVVAVFLVFIFGVTLGWFPTLGAGNGFAGHFTHLTLPAVALALATIAYMARVTQASVNDELQKEHVETARARGLPERRVIRRHVLRNAWIPISTAGAVTVAALIAGDAVIETAFGLNGLGAYLIQEVEAKDFPVVQAICLILVLVFTVLNTAVDALYVVADPRIRTARERH
jgi:peptide/nickel transport system permease protein